MLPKHCAHCHRLFIPNRTSDLSVIFCRSCIALCEEAYGKISKYLQRNPSASAVKITIALGLPALFVHHLFRSGRFSAALSVKKSSDKRPCSICRRILKPHEEVYCTACNSVIDKRMHTQYRTALATDLPPAAGIDQNITDLEAEDKKRKFYGFGRSI